MASLLVIGGTGYFGKSILDSFRLGLLEKFEISKIIVLARNIDQFKIDYPELATNGVEFICGDITNITSIPICDYIIHAAAITNMNEYQSSLFISAKENSENAISNFCKLAIKLNIKSKILYCSSGIVYGKQPDEVEKISEEFKFLDNLDKLSVEKRNYCIGKRYAEVEFIKLGKLGLNVSIARCFSFKGKYLPKNQHYAYGNFIANAERGEDIIVNAKGLVFRSYMDSSELVNGLLVISEQSNQNCPIYNLGSDEIVEIHDLAKQIANKYKVDVKFANFNKNVIDRYIPNIDKFKALVNIKSPKNESK